ncbi:MAG: hypothetical protein HY329_27450 [Chloroflexi bacterium]|nr:hypothetical protein [Chloroflexota bacterium]
MRMMVKVSQPVETGNQKIADGSLPRLIQGMVGELKAEAAYFLTMEGKRTALIFFDLADSSQIPAVAEPFFMGLNAAVEFYPVMTGEDLAKGLAAAEQVVKRYL